MIPSNSKQSTQRKDTTVECSLQKGVLSQPQGGDYFIDAVCVFKSSYQHQTGQTLGQHGKYLPSVNGLRVVGDLRGARAGAWAGPARLAGGVRFVGRSGRLRGGARSSWDFSFLRWTRSIATRSTRCRCSAGIPISLVPKGHWRLFRHI